MSTTAKCDVAPAPRSASVAGLTALLTVLLLAAPGVAHAQEGDGFAPPPPPREQPAIMAGEVHVDLVLALNEGPICPAVAKCIFNSGGGIGGILEKRYPTGVALGVGYDAWLLDGNGVYELSVMQVLRGVLRYQFLRNRFVHPWLGVGFGPMLFGDTFRVATVGAALDLSAGLEVEISENLAGTFAITGRMFSNTSFTSDNDSVDRSDSFGVNVAAGIQVGLVILEERRRPR